MQSLALLWFQLQMTQPYLREKTFPAAQVPGNPPNLDTPIGIGTLQRVSVKQGPRIESAKRNRKLFPLPVGAGVCLAIRELIAVLKKFARTGPVNYNEFYNINSFRTVGLSVCVIF
jgi:hypothetical protein